MDAAGLRQFCLGFPGAFEDFPFGPETSVFKVRSSSASGGGVPAAKMFALSSLDARNLAVSLKCEPALAEQLRAAHPEITGAWHLNKTHWNGVSLSGSLPDWMVCDMIEDSYDLVVATLSRSQQAQLGWSRLAQGSVRRGRAEGTPGPQSGLEQEKADAEATDP